MADYVDKAQLAAFSQELAALSDDQQDFLVTAASRLFDNLCEVPENFFSVATGDETRVRFFYGDGTAYLKIDPYVTLNSDSESAIVIDPDGDGTIVRPENGVNANPVYAEIDNQLVMLDKVRFPGTPDANRFTGWPYGVKVLVEADWGFTAIPFDVSWATLALAGAWRLVDPANAVVSSAEGAFAKANSIADVYLQAIEKYKRKYSRRALFA